MLIHHIITLNWRLKRRVVHVLFISINNEWNISQLFQLNEGSKSEGWSNFVQLCFVDRTGKFPLPPQILDKTLNTLQEPTTAIVSSNLLQPSHIQPIVSALSSTTNSSPPRSYLHISATVSAFSSAAIHLHQNEDRRLFIETDDNLTILNTSYHWMNAQSASPRPI